MMSSIQNYPTTDGGVIAPKVWNFATFMFSKLLSWKRKEINNHWKDKSCSANLDLSVCKISCWSDNLWQLLPLKSPFLHIFYFSKLLFWKRKEINNHCKNKTCSANQDLSVCKISCRSKNLWQSYCPWKVHFCTFLLLEALILKRKADK